MKKAAIFSLFNKLAAFDLAVVVLIWPEVENLVKDEHQMSPQFETSEVQCQQFLARFISF